MGLALKAQRHGLAPLHEPVPAHALPGPRAVALGVVPTPTPAPHPPPQRWVWEHRYGRMCIEVREGQVYVDGQRVVPHQG